MYPNFDGDTRHVEFWFDEIISMMLIISSWLPFPDVIPVIIDLSEDNPILLVVLHDDYYDRKNPKNR